MNDPLRQSPNDSQNHERLIVQRDELEDMMSRSAKKALEEFRNDRKMSREDKGTGSTVLGNILAHHRSEGGETQASLARRTGIHPTTISKIEKGQRGMSLETFLKLADSLGIDFLDEMVVYYVYPESHPRRQRLVGERS